MTARLEHKLCKDKNITQLFIDSPDGKICMCSLRFSSDPVFNRFAMVQLDKLEFEMNSLVKAINSGVIEVVEQ